MSRRTRVYVAGPISLGDRDENHRQLQQAGDILRLNGYAPFVPEAEFESSEPELSHEQWMGCDLPYVQISDCLLRLDGDSKGADLEVGTAIEAGIPVYYRLVDLLKSEPQERHGDERFHALLQSIGRLHDVKQQDYGTDGDPFANVRASAQFGVEPWLGCLVRMNDKVTRIQNFATKRTLANESFEDALMDLAVYSLIALILYREES